MALALGLDYWLIPQISANYYFRYAIDDAAVQALLRVVMHILELRGLAVHLSSEDWLLEY